MLARRALHQAEREEVYRHSQSATGRNMCYKRCLGVLTLLEPPGRAVVRLVDIEEGHVVSQLVVELRVGVLYRTALRQLPCLCSERQTYLERDRAPTARAQAPASVHTHHACPGPACRVVAHKPTLVVLGDVLADLHLQLRLQARHTDGPMALRAGETGGLDERFLICS